MEQFLHYLSLEYLLLGIGYTVIITLWGLALGMVGGAILAAMQGSRFKLLSTISRGYAIIFRGTPLILQMVFVYDALPLVGIRLSALAAGAVALAANEAPFIAEIFRSSLLSVGQGQITAGRALALSPSVIRRKVVFPQAFRNMLPAMGNETVSALKNSSLASVISVHELTLRSTQLASSTFDFFSVFFASGLMYLILTGIIAVGQLIMERLFSFEKSVKFRARHFRPYLSAESDSRYCDQVAGALSVPGGNASGIEIKNLTKSYGSNTILSGLGMTVEPGKVVALIGPSGSGKSTLLRCLNGLDPYNGGSIRVNGQLVGRTEDGRVFSEAEMAEQRRKMGIEMVFQNFNLFEHLSAIENVALPLVWSYGVSREEAFDTAQALLDRVGLSERYESLPSQLSGGQQQRVAIARALATRPRILLMDEPTSALDPELVSEVLDLITSLAQTGNLTMLISTHQIRFAEHVADDCAFLAEGRIVEFGPAHDVINHPKMERTRKFLAMMEKTQ